MDILTDLPRNVEAERAFTGALVILGYVPPEVADIDPDQAIGNVVLRDIVKLAKKLTDDGTEFDHLLISEKLKSKHGDVYSLLSELTASTPSSAMIEQYAGLLRTTGAKRRTALLSHRLGKLAWSQNGGGPEEIFDQVDAELEALRGGADLSAQDAPISYDELQAMTWPNDAELLPELIPNAGLSSLSGETGAGKTFLAADLALAVAEAGEAWGGRQVTRGGNVLYFGIDNSTRTLQIRTHELALARSINPLGFHIYQHMLDLSSDAGAARLRRLVESYDAVLVVLDMLSRYVGTVDLHRLDEVGSTLMRLRRIADETGTSILLLHRLNKQRQTYGSVEIEGGVDSAMKLTLQIVGDEPIRTLEHTKHRDRDLVRSMKFSIEQGEHGGLYLAFDQHQGPERITSVVEDTAEAMVEILRDADAAWLNRVELLEQLDDKPGQRNFNVACALLHELPNVNVQKLGRAYAYQFKDPDE